MQIDITEEIIQSHIDKIVEIINSIQLNKLTVLVGDNGVGKSLIRKQLGVRLKKNNGIITRSISQELRTSSIAEFGGMSGIFRDNEWSPTSICTYDLLNHLVGNLNSGNKDYSDKYFVIDEPDIGMSKESEYGIAKILCSMKTDFETKCSGCLVITHSDIIVKELVDIGCEFICLQYDKIIDDYQLWRDRIICPTNFEWLDAWSSALFLAVRDRSKPTDLKK